MFMLPKRTLLVTRQRFNKIVTGNNSVFSCFFSDTAQKEGLDKKYKLLVVGGGTGGTSIASIFGKSLKRDCAVIEPNEVRSDVSK